MHVMLAEPVGLEPPPHGVRAHPRPGCLRGLPPHVAELSRDREPSLSRVCGRLEEENVAAHGREGKAGGDTGIRRALAHLALEASRAEPAANTTFVDAHGLRARLAFGDLPRCLAEQ